MNVSCKDSRELQDTVGVSRRRCTANRLPFQAVRPANCAANRRATISVRNDSEHGRLAGHSVQLRSQDTRIPASRIANPRLDSQFHGHSTAESVVETNYTSRLSRRQLRRVSIGQCVAKYGNATSCQCTRARIAAQLTSSEGYRHNVLPGLFRTVRRPLRAMRQRPGNSGGMTLDSAPSGLEHCWKIL